MGIPGWHFEAAEMFSFLSDPLIRKLFLVDSTRLCAIIVVVWQKSSCVVIFLRFLAQLEIPPHDICAL